jgi:RNA polymerase sigma-70 factor (ECF subfamily)
VADDTPLRDDIRMARRGNRAALERVLERTQPRLLRMAEVRLGPRLRKKIRPSDVLQSAYVEVVRRIPDFAGDSDEEFVTWMGSVIENAIRDRRRYFDAAKRGGGSEVAEVRLEAAMIQDRGQRDPSAVLSTSEDLALLEEALANLEEPQRRVLSLVVKEGKTHREAAEILGKTEGATRVLLTRARATLLLEVDRLRNRDGGGTGRGAV